VAGKKWANKVTAEFWRCVSADPKCLAYWKKDAERIYRRSLVDDPMPGIWPKFSARTELALNIHQALEEGGRGVPKGFAAPLDEPELSLVDCYSLAERILDDELVDRMDKSGKLRPWVPPKKKGKKK
jgi:hypothetical protein